MSQSAKFHLFVYEEPHSGNLLVWSAESVPIKENPGGESWALDSWFSHSASDQMCEEAKALQVLAEIISAKLKESRPTDTPSCGATERATVNENTIHSLGLTSPRSSIPLTSCKAVKSRADAMIQRNKVCPAFYG